MASVYCPSCKGKITQRDATCPRCGASTSRIIPIVLGIAVFATCFVLFNSYQKTTKQSGLADSARGESTKVEVNVPDSSQLGLSEE